jgi:ketosteroid isomerase-like protein
MRSTPTAGTAADEEAIRKVLATYVETWNRHDIEAWGRLFTDDVDYVNRAGGWWKGNRENVEGHQVIHSFLRPDTAIVHATWEMTGFTRPSGEIVKDFKGIIGMVMVKQDGDWLIRAVQNTVTTPTKPKRGRA